MQYRIQSQFIPKLVIQVSKSIPLKTHTIQYSLEVVFSGSCSIPHVIFSSGISSLNLGRIMTIYSPYFRGEIQLLFLEAEEQLISVGLLIVSVYIARHCFNLSL